MNGNQPVRVTDIDMTFGSMVLFMVKWAIASIPAFIILSALMAGVGVVIVTVLSVIGVAVSR